MKRETLVELEGVNGEWFTLSGGDHAGHRGVYLDTKLVGIYDDPTTAIYNQHAFQIGADFGGIRIDKRDIVFGVHIIDSDEGSWQFNDSEFRKALSYTKDAKLWIETEDSRRFLPIRLSETPQFAPESDPNVDGYGNIVFTCVAANPRWQEPDETDEWVAVTDTVSSGTASGFVTVSNPTDTEIWLKWVVQAYPGAKYTLPDYSFGDDRYRRAVTDAARKIAMPTLQAGEHLKVNTDEAEDQVASSTDTQVWMRMNGVSFLYPIPPYTPATDLPVSVQKAPAGVGVQVRCPRTWSRPFGLQ